MAFTITVMVFAINEIETMEYRWLNWLKEWRTIAEESSTTEYIPIITTVDGTDYEVLRVSKFHQGYDGDTPHVKTAIREFNDKTALHSKATRDLGIVRVITNNHKLAFVIKPGADVLKWRAVTQGVSVKRLVEVMRAGDIGRRVRRRDRRAAKNSREQLTAERNDKKIVMQQRDRMRENLIKQNAEQYPPGTVLPGSGTMACALGTAEERGIKLTSTTPLPGSFEG